VVDRLRRQRWIDQALSPHTEPPQTRNFWSALPCAVQNPALRLRPQHPALLLVGFQSQPVFDEINRILVGTLRAFRSNELSPQWKIQLLQTRIYHD
jgi:hypothetical protein